MHGEGLGLSCSNFTLPKPSGTRVLCQSARKAAPASFEFPERKISEVQIPKKRETGADPHCQLRQLTRKQAQHIAPTFVSNRKNAIGSIHEQQRVYPTRIQPPAASRSDRPYGIRQTLWDRLRWQGDTPVPGWLPALQVPRHGVREGAVHQGGAQLRKP